MPVPPDIAQRLTELGLRLKVDRSERDFLIREAHRAGASLREIAEHAGITHVAVKRIVDRPPNT